KISEPTTFEITNQSPVPLATADIYLDNALLDTVRGPTLSYALDPTGLSGGNHVVRVHVRDTAGDGADTSMTVAVAGPGLIRRIPVWVVLGLVLRLPLVALIGIFLLNGRRRGLRCATCGRPLEAGWSACPYCSRPEPTPAAVPVVVNAAPPPAGVSGVPI